MLNCQTPLDLMFTALADPSRRSMVERLGRGSASVSELAAPLSMSLPAVMRHLRVLESSGLVRSEKAGRVRTCRIDPSALRTAEDWIAGRRLSVSVQSIELLPENGGGIEPQLDTAAKALTTG